jgi:SAM-dependent methyltransferase
MSGYAFFARYYDSLTANVDYPARARYFDALIRRVCPGASLLLDLACGTGSLTAELAALGYDMIGADASEDMLAAARGKLPGGVLLLHQRAEELDLYGTIDGCVCALDSLNHLPGEAALQKAIERVSLFLGPGGVFVFDMNTPYKHREILADNAYIYEGRDVFCAWRNALSPDNDRVEITLDFFVPTARGAYRRETENFCEYAYPPEKITNMLAAAGLEVCAIYEGDTENPPTDTTQRVVFVTRKP